MPNINATDRERQLSYKKLLSKLYTDLNKATNEEFGAHALKLDYTDVWADDIPYNKPYEAITTHNLDGKSIVDGVLVETDNGVIAEGREYKLVQFLSATDTTSFFIPAGDETEEPEITNRLDGFVSDKYGANYAPRLFYNGVEMSPGEFGWLFDCDTGILSFRDDQKLVSPPRDMSKYTIKAYRYTGRTVKDATGETYDEDLGNLIIQPNKKINLLKDLGINS